MTIHLVTGAAGFVGSHLVDRLMETGDQVVAIDDLSSGNLDNLSRWMDNGRFMFKQQSVTDHIGGEYDKIWHLACPASPVAYQSDPFHTLNTCYVGTYNVLDVARRCGAKVLITSTSEVYGDPKEHPQKETYLGNVNTFGPRACYDEGKRVAETLVYNFIKEYGVDVIITRLFNTYGPRLSPDDGRVISNFIKQSLNGEPHTIYGDGKTTRSFCYVEDTVRALVELIDKGEQRIYNVGNPDEYTLLELSETISDICGHKTNQVFKERPQDDPLVRRPDITRIKTDIGWEPMVGLREGLEATVNHYRNLK